MNAIIKAAIIAAALSAGAVTVQAETSYDDLIAKGQVVHPNGTAGAK